jgi:carboxypeptidase PM20D1
MRTTTLRARLILFLSAALLLLIGVLLVRAASFGSRQPHVERVNLPEVDADAAAKHLAGALRFETVSREDASSPVEALRGLQGYLRATFPRVHAALALEVISEHSLLFRWEGSDPTLQPMLLAAHMDVVPATNDSWTHPPFEGVIADGFVWGRGAVDDKLGVMGILEAVELLLTEGFRPKRTVYLAFGHDEEIGGAHGAADMAALLATRGVRLELVLDEGLPIAVGIVPGVAPPVALVGIAEKGYVTIELSTQAVGGHSSTPPSQTAIGVLAAAVRAVEARPFHARFGGVAVAMFDSLAPQLPFAQRVVFANRWLFSPVIERVLSGAPETDALIRTTTAVTVIEGGVKDNVLPSSARALVNFRTLPGDEPDDVLAHVQGAVDDRRVQARIVNDAWGGTQPAPVPSEVFDGLGRTVLEVFTDAVVAPGLMLGATDARRYSALSANVYRFTPVPMRSEDIARIHGRDERVAVADFVRSVQFYYRVVRDGA